MTRPQLFTFAAPALVALTLSACRNPLKTYDDELGRRVDAASLRSADNLPLTDHAVLDEKRYPEEQLQERPDLYVGAATRDVSIEQCRVWTLENNLDLKVAMIAPEISVTAVSEEEARFESAFFARMRLSDAEPGQIEVFRDQFVRPFDFEPGVRIPLRTGGTVMVALPISKRQTFPGTPDDQWATDVDFSISQPLLRNAGRRANTHRIRISSIQSQIATAGTKLEVIRHIAAVDRSYWLLYEANELLIVRQRQYERAIDQLGKAEARFKGGVGPEIEVVRAQAGVSRRLESIILAELLVKDRQRTLKRIINLRDADVDSKVMLVLASSPDPVRYELDSDELLAASLDKRIELLELELQLAQDLSTIEFAENQKLPLFTLDYTYRIHGAGTSFPGSFAGAGTPSGWGWILGLNLEVPLGNEAAEARVHRAILTRLQRLATRSLREQAIKQEVLNALDNLEASWQRIMAAMQNVALEGRNYVAEQGQFRLGLRNSTEVLDAENRLANANAAEVSAIIDYQIAQIDLAFATGMLLGATQVTW